MLLLACSSCRYHPEKGLYYSYILPNLVVGSQPRTKEDVDHIAERVGAKTILNLQQVRRRRGLRCALGSSCCPAPAAADPPPDAGRELAS